MANELDDMVLDMEVDVADEVTNMVVVTEVDKVADMLAYMEVDKVADMEMDKVAGMEVDKVDVQCSLFMQPKRFVVQRVKYRGNIPLLTKILIIFENFKKLWVLWSWMGGWGPNVITRKDCNRCHH